MTLTASREMNAALAAAAEWRLLGLLFERPRAGWLEEIEPLAREVEEPVLRSAAAAARRAVESDYLAVLGPGRAVSPREVGYRGMHDPGHILSDIGVFHKAFGFVPRREEPIDHIAVEASFVGYLLLKEAYAHAQGDADAAQTAASAAARFIESHLQYFAAPFAERTEAAGLEHVALAARVLAAHTGQPAMPPKFDEDDEGKFDCDGCAGIDGCPAPPA